jgi:hypothetical protein
VIFRRRQPVPHFPLWMVVHVKNQIPVVLTQPMDLFQEVLAMPPNQQFVLLRHPRVLMVRQAHTQRVQLEIQT